MEGLGRGPQTFPDDLRQTLDPSTAATRLRTRMVQLVYISDSDISVDITG